MCFAPQRRALFRYLNFQKWSEHVVFCTCWLRNVLRATTACTFSTSQLPKVLRTWRAFSFFTCKCASRHNGVHFFISHLARWIRTRRFSEPEPQIIGKTQCFATFLPFRASASSFFWLFLFWSSLFYSSLLSDSSHPCFSCVHIVGSLTSKFPSIINYIPTFPPSHATISPFESHKIPWSPIKSHWTPVNPYHIPMTRRLCSPVSPNDSGPWPSRVPGWPPWHPRAQRWRPMPRCPAPWSSMACRRSGLPMVILGRKSWDFMDKDGDLCWGSVMEDISGCDGEIMGYDRL